VLRFCCDFLSKLVLVTQRVYIKVDVTVQVDSGPFKSRP
jgi:hypothetical protein